MGLYKLRLCIIAKTTIILLYLHCFCILCTNVYHSDTTCQSKTETYRLFPLIGAGF